MASPEPRASAAGAAGGRRFKLTRDAAALLRQKTFSMVPVDAQVNIPFQTKPRPSELALLRAYQESPWLHLKIARLSAAFASLEYRVLADVGTPAPVQLPDTYPLARLLRHPNPFLRGWDFRFLTELYVRTIGACWWRIVPDAFGVPQELWIYPNNWVKPLLYTSSMTVTVELKVPFLSWRVERVPIEQMIWVRMPDAVEPYAQGLGDALSIATEVDTFELASESDRRFFQNDASPPGALVIPGRVEQHEVDRIRDEWQRKYGGAVNAGTVPLLFGGMDFKTFRQGRKEMDFVDGQRYLRDVILAGMHKHILGVSDQVTFASAKAAEYQVSRWEIAPRVSWWDDYIDLIAQRFDPRVKVRWRNPIPQDEQLELQRATQGWINGTVTRNEWRMKNGYDPLPSEFGDVMILQAGVEQVPVPGQSAADQRDQVAALMEGRAPAPGQIRMLQRRDAEPRLGPGHPRWQRLLERIQGGVDDAAAMDALRPLYESVMRARLADVREELGIDPKLAIGDPTLLQYLKHQAGERIRKVDDTTRQRIRDAIADGVTRGEDLPDLEARVAAVFDDAKGARAALIAHTETIDASNATAYAAYQRSGVVEQIEWLLDPDYDPTKDDGECQDIADSGPIQVGETFAGGVAWPPAHPSCLPGDALITPCGRVAASSERWYEGDLVVIRTASNQRVRCTPNHPILTRSGWQPAQLLQVGDQVLKIEAGAAVHPHDQHVPAPIQQVARALDVPVMMVPVAAPDFHGDGIDGEVAVIRTDRLLQRDLNAALRQAGRDLPLERRREHTQALLRQGRSAPDRERHAFAAPGRMRGLHEGVAINTGSIELRPEAPGAVLARDLRVAQYPSNDGDRDAVALREMRQGVAGQEARRENRGIQHPWADAVSELDAALRQPAPDRVAADAVRASQLKHGLSGSVAWDYVVRIDREPFHGPVFNLQTESGWYLAGSIVTHNCECALAPLVAEEKGVKAAPRWRGEDRPKHARDLQREHARLARQFQNRMTRLFQSQQRAVTKALREAWAETAA